MVVKFTFKRNRNKSHIPKTFSIRFLTKKKNKTITEKKKKTTFLEDLITLQETGIFIGVK